MAELPKKKNIRLVYQPRHLLAQRRKPRRVRQSFRPRRPRPGNRWRPHNT